MRTVFMVSTDRLFTWRGKLPFIPNIGLMIDPGDGNFWEVERVYYKGGELLTVYLKPIGATESQMIKWGWKVY